MSRPPKPRKSTHDGRAHDDADDHPHLAGISRQLTLNHLRVDPLNHDPELTTFLSDVIIGEASDFAEEVAGKMLVGAVKNLTADDAEVFFGRVITLKRNFEDLPHRNNFAYLAYSRYIEATGKEPTKDQLRKYIIARPEEFGDRPHDKTGWTRLWKDSGLFSLP